MKTMLIRTTIAGTFFSLTAIASEASGTLNGRIATLHVQLNVLKKKANGPHLTAAYKEDVLKLDGLLTAIKHMSIKNSDPELLSQILTELASRISAQASRRDICQKDFTSLATQQCLKLSLPQPRPDVSIVAAGSKFLMVGGDPKSVMASALDILDAETSAWTSGSLPTTKGRVGVQSVGPDRAVVYNIDRSTTVPSIKLDLFDSSTNSWFSSSISTSLSNINSATAGHKIVFWAEGSAQSELDLFDADKKSWSRIPAPSNTPWRVSFNIESKAAFVRSSPAAPRKESILDIYDSSQSTWSMINIPPEHQTLFDAGIAAHGKIYLLTDDSESGLDESLGEQRCRTKLVIHDLKSGSWNQTFVPGCNGTRWSLAAADSKIVLTGDARGSKAYVLHTNSGRWDTVTFSETDRVNQIAVSKTKMAIISNDNIYRVVGSRLPSELNIYEPSQNAWTATSALKVFSGDPIGSIGRINYVQSTYGKLGGWAVDPKDPSKNLKVKFYLDGDRTQGRFVGETIANIDGYDNFTEGFHGFTFRLPIRFIDNKKHTLYAYAVDSEGSEKVLPGSPFTYATFVPNSTSEARQRLSGAMRFYTPCSGCHGLGTSVDEYFWLWVLAASDFNMETWSTENNALVRKLRSDQHGGVPQRFSPEFIRDVKYWLESNFPDYADPTEPWF